MRFVNKNIIIIVLFFFTLNGCVQHTAFLGPAVTAASSGSIYQAGLSYGSNQLVEKITGKSTFENFQELLIPKNDDHKIVKSLKVNIEKRSQEFIDLKKEDKKILKQTQKNIEKVSMDFYASVKNLYLLDQANQ
tara:strand:+ start:120 stop:521 length:402 start_codon:yes stop_codon:yes gene_type:complete